MKIIPKIIFLFLFLPIFPALSAEDISFASLKKDKVNWRTGPGEKYPIQWIYQEQGYPVKVLDTYDIWRQVQDISGTIGWVHKNMLSSRRTVLVQEEGSLTDKPQIDSHTVAFVEPGTTAQVLKCPSNYKYCLLSFNHQNKKVEGWFLKASLWGITPNEEID